MLPYAGSVDPESTLAIGVHHVGHLEDTERTFCYLYHTLMFPVHHCLGPPKTKGRSPCVRRYLSRLAEKER